MTTLQTLLDQQAAIARQIEELKKGSKQQAIAEVQALMREHGLTVTDLAATPKRSAGADSTRAGKKVEPKFRDPTSGQTWTGRGLKPTWLRQAVEAGKDLESFRI
jgi:DNA-binding protein H-NS